MSCCCPQTGAGRVLWWHSFIAILGILTSIFYNRFILDQYYASGTASEWILVGGITSSSVEFRIRLEDNRQSTLELWKENNINDPDFSLEVSPDTQVDDIQYGISAITVDNLESQTKYLYKVGGLSGSFRTPAPEGVAFNFTIAAASCAMTASQSPIFDTIREDHPDLQLFLHMGDFHYEDINENDLEKRLDAVSKVLNSGPQAKLFRNVPLAYTWDDHDYLANQEEGVQYSDNARETALESYQMAFPHYPLAAVSGGDTNNQSSIDPTPIYHAFTIGTVRFIITDLQSESTGAFIMSPEQQDWLLQELSEAANFDFVIMVSSKPWIGNETLENRDSTYGSWITSEYQDQRQAVADVIDQVIGGSDGPQNLLVLAGDAHMVAFDDGRNTYYGTSQNENRTDPVYSFPLLQSAPLDRHGSIKGGPFSDGCESCEWERTNQYSAIHFSFPQEDTDEAACISISSYRIDEYYYKERIFHKHLCGKLFQSTAVEEDGSTDSCTIEHASSITLGLLVVSVVIAALVGGASCLVVIRDQSLEARTSKCWYGFLSVAIAWLSGALVVGMGAAMPVANGVTNITWRTSLLIAITMYLIMGFCLFGIMCCCSRRRHQQEEADLNLKEATEVEGTSDAPSHMTIPTFVREATTKQVSESQLPEGVILHGGEQLHKEGLTGKGIKVAVIDSGVDIDHPGFKGQIKQQVWLRSGTPLEQDDHGTHVAGTIHLMAPQADLYDYRVFGNEGKLSIDQAIATAIRDATDAQCHIINMSLGGPVPNNAIWEAVQYASKRGVVLVCAAGNEGDNNPLTNEISFPASYKECISVAAVAKANGFPVAMFSNSNPLVDCAGIGVEVVSFKPGGGFQNMSGTSMACPHVAGLIACLMTNGKHSAASIRDTLQSLAIDIDAIGFDNATGVGFVTYLNENVFDQLLPRR